MPNKNLVRHLTEAERKAWGKRMQEARRRIREAAEAATTTATATKPTASGKKPVVKPHEEVKTGKVIKPEGDKTRQYVKVTMGVIMIVIGLLFGVVWWMTASPFPVLGLVAFGGAGGWLLTNTVKKKVEQTGAVFDDKDTGKNYKVGEKPNTLVIREKVIGFEYVKEPGGYPMKCRNDGQVYYVMIEEMVGKVNTGRLIPFELPDNSYFDPREFVNVLTLPGHSRVLRRKESLFEKLQPLWLVLAGVVLWLLIMTTTGTNNG